MEVGNHGAAMGGHLFIMPMKLWFLGDILLGFLQRVPHCRALFNATEHVI
jgi:hypothetical protein